MKIEKQYTIISMFGKEGKLSDCLDVEATLDVIIDALNSLQGETSNKEEKTDISDTTCQVGLSEETNMTQELHSTWERQFEKRQSVREQNSFLDYGDDDCPPEVNWEEIKDFIKTVEQEAHERGKDELRNELAPVIKTVEEICRQARKEERDSLKKKVEEKYGKQGTMSGSLGYQGILAGIHAYKTEGDYTRDYLLSLLSEE